MNTSAEREFGFKLPTEENWLKPDDVWAHFVPLGDGIPPPDARYASSIWLAEVREPTMSADVPLEIRSLFEVARSSIIYGYLCYPLLTLGEEQLYRVLETAARMKADKLGCPRVQGCRGDPDRRASFDVAIRWLNEKEVISSADIRWWKCAKELRNYFSHPEMQRIQMPGQAVQSLHMTAELTSSLFVEKGAQPSEVQSSSAPLASSAVIGR